MARGGRTCTSGQGRKKGVPNKSTTIVRNAIAVFAEANVEKMGEWLGQVAQEDPGKALDLYLKAIEYHIPKLARQEISADVTVRPSDGLKNIKEKRERARTGD